MAFNEVEICNADASIASLLREGDHIVVEGVANGV